MLPPLSLAPASELLPEYPLSLAAPAAIGRFFAAGRFAGGAGGAGLPRTPLEPAPGRAGGAGGAGGGAGLLTTSSR